MFGELGQHAQPSNRPKGWEKFSMIIVNGPKRKPTRPIAIDSTKPTDRNVLMVYKLGEDPEKTGKYLPTRKDGGISTSSRKPTRLPGTYTPNRSGSGEVSNS